MSLHDVFDKYTKEVSEVEEKTVIENTGVNYDNIKNLVMNEIHGEQEQNRTKKGSNIMLFRKVIPFAAAFAFVIAAAVVGTHFLKKDVPVTPADPSATSVTSTTEKQEDVGKKGSNGIWEYTEYAETITLTRYLAAAPEGEIKELVIPDEINSKPVTDMAKEIFEHFAKEKIKILKWVFSKFFVIENGVVFNNDKTTILCTTKDFTCSDYTIPVGVKTICASAFNYTELESITIPNTVTSIGDFAFDSCLLKSIKIPNSVTYIGEAAFQSCNSLTNVTLPKSIKSISKWAFANCGKLASITIPESVTSIGEYAFGGSGLKSITIPGSVTTIDASAFSDCCELQNIAVAKENKNYTSADGSLYNKAKTKLLQCPGGKSGTINIPGSVTSIGDEAFRNCRKLANITVDKGNQIYASVDGILYNKAKTELILCPKSKSGTVNIPNSVTSIGLDTFCYCNNLTNITIGSGVTSIDDIYAFSGCTSLTNITVSEENNNYASVDGNLYNKSKTQLIVCPKGKAGTVNIPNGVTSVNRAFEGCKNLTSIILPESVTSIGENAFWGCEKLTNITVSEKSNAYASIDGILYNKAKTQLIKCPVDKAGTVNIPNGVTSIGNEAFSGCANITNITIPNSVTSIDCNAFYFCTNLTNIIIPNSVTSIGDSAFEGCKKLASLTIGNGVKSVGRHAFMDCVGLKSVKVPKSVNKIDSYAFGYFAKTYKDSFHEYMDTASIEGFTIYGASGSAAEKYAKDNSFKFIAQ